MLIEFVGKFYDNHSLSIVNRNIVLNLVKQGAEVRIAPLDSYDPQYAIDKSDIRILKALETTKTSAIPSVQVRHSYPPLWSWPSDSSTKVVFIQPWEYPKALFEWQYKFETFADALIVPSNYCYNTFAAGGMPQDNLFVVPNGYSDSIFNKEADTTNKYGINPDKFNFVYVGNSQWRKGLDILLQAWSVAFNKADNAKLIIKDNPRVYGQSNILAEVLKMQFQTNCGEIVYIDDELSSKEMAGIYAASKVVVHPYRAEGFGMHIQEAMACGSVPIISANGPTDDFIPQDKGLRIPVAPTPINIADPGLFILKPGDSTTLMSTHTIINEPSVDYLVKAMKYVYHSHDRDAILDKLRVNDMPNTWEQVTGQYLAILTDVANRSSTNRAK